jgi:hypothetical protein
MNKQIETKGLYKTLAEKIPVSIWGDLVLEGVARDCELEQRLGSLLAFSVVWLDWLACAPSTCAHEG